jgi:ATP-dependent DNA helicase PIF1
MTQDQAFDILAMGQNIFLTGAAGTGKTYLINRFIRHCHEHGIVIAITASTGIAATHIGGMTIHSWSGLGIRDTLTDGDIDDIISREYLVKRYAKTQVLIIDEISMLSGNFLSNLDRLLRSARVSPLPFGGMQVVIVGDFFQLPPVSRGVEYVEFAFEHPVWRELKLIPCVLTEQFRQSQDPLLDILTEIRSGTISQRSKDLLASRNIAVETEDHTELFTKNIAVDAYNTERLNAIREDIFVFEMQGKWGEKLVEALKKWCLAPETLVLKIWARVMFVKNNFDAGYANGSLGHIVGRYEWLPIVELMDGTKIIADYASWSIEENGKVKAEIAQVPLRLAWAITVHKSQGMTLDSAVMDLSDCFVPGQGYVALSRVRSLSGLILRGANVVALQIDPRVRQYDVLLRDASERAEERLSQIGPDEKKEKTNLAIRRLWWVTEKLDLSIDGGVKKWKKISTHLETYELILAGKSLDDIAILRNLKPSTIWSHLEKLLEEWKTIDLTPYRPADEERLSQIIKGFIILSTLSLSPVREYLRDIHDEDFDYDEVRIARLFLSDAEHRKITQDMLYASEGIEM